MHMFNFEQQWGKLAAINLRGCDHEKLIDPELIKDFVQKVVKEIGMETHGPCYVERFGAGQLQGYSAMQFIKTSSIALHLDEVGNRAFVDIFSCKEFDAEKAKEFTQKFFTAAEAEMTVIKR